MSDKENKKNGGPSLRTLELMLGLNNKAYTFTLIDSIEQTKDTITKAIKDSKVIETTINDAYGNKLTATGTYDVVKSFNSYGFSNDTLNWPLWLALYNDSWVFRRAIDKPAQDMVRSGIKLILDNNKIDEVIDEVNRQRKGLIELIQWGRLYGGAVAVMMFDNFEDKDYEKAINIDKLKKAKKMTLYVTDRWYGCCQSDKMVNDMNEVDDYGKPDLYKIIFGNNHEINVHHSFILRYEGRTAPKLLKNGYLNGWGYAEGAHLISKR